MRYWVIDHKFTFFSAICKKNSEKNSNHPPPAIVLEYTDLKNFPISATMKRAYKISIILLILASLMIVLEMFDVVVPPGWLSQTIGGIMLASLYSVVYIRVRRSVPRYRY